MSGNSFIVGIMVLVVLSFGFVSAAEKGLLFYEGFEDLDSINENSGKVSRVVEKDFLSGIVGNGIDFSGNKRVCYPLKDNFNTGKGTIQFWVRPKNSNYHGFFDIGGLGSPNSWGIFKNRDHIIMEVKNKFNSYDQAWSTGPLKYDGNWHCIVAPYVVSGDTTNFKVCVDGECKSSYDGIKSQNNLDLNNDEFCIGWSGWYGYSESQFDELKIYDYAMSNNQIKNACKLADKDRDGFDISKDCDDSNKKINPGATEVCNQKDDDCDNLVDEDGVCDECRIDSECDDGLFCNGAEKCSGGVCVLGEIIKCDDELSCTEDICNEDNDKCEFTEIDVDGDGFGICSGARKDCNDGNSDVNPGEKEICNYLDDDCSGEVDDGLSCTERDGEDRAYDHLYDVMDKFHSTFDVYTNQDEGGNHFFPSGWMGEFSSLGFDGNYNRGCYSNPSCIKIRFNPSGKNWAGIYWQNPENNWGDFEKGGYDLTGASKLTFMAKGESGNERVLFYVGGIKPGTRNGDSLGRNSIGYLKLTDKWKEYTINLKGKKLNHVIGGFGFSINKANNNKGATFYIDDIQFDKSREEDLRFLVSYETQYGYEEGPDRYLKNAAFVYDNALALLVLLARGNDEDMRRAKILADSFVFVLENDRFYTDGRIRNAYMSGDLVDYNTGEARIPGWWDDEDGKWYEDEFQVSTHTGNMAWVMIALLNYYKKSGGVEYLEAAERIGNWVDKNVKDSRCGGGYTGGFEGWEPNPSKLNWKSTEHNIDLYVAFKLLYELTGNEAWMIRSEKAKSFVEDMWNSEGKYFWTGTDNDGCTINKNVIPIDIQVWSVMAFDDYHESLDWVENNALVEIDGFRGIDFNDDKDGVWFEGTAQTAIASQMAGKLDKSDMYLREIEKAQNIGENSNGKGIIAASHDGVTTGFDWEYFSRLHVGATAWYLFGKRGVNPYWMENSIKDVEPGLVCSRDSDCGVDKWVGSVEWCALGDVKKLWRTYSCLDIGTSIERCSHVDKPRTYIDCVDNGCTEGECNNVDEISDCGNSDLNGDGKVDTFDLGKILDNWGKRMNDIRDGDVNSDGIVNSLDLAIVLDNWGIIC
jgi:hypothetical protein